MDGKGALTSLLWEDFMVAPLEPAGPCRLLILDEKCPIPTLRRRWAGARPLRDPLMERHEFQLKKSLDFGGLVLAHLKGTTSGCEG